MASLRSWLGSVLSLLLFFAVRRFTAGLAVPACVAVVFALVYIWVLVLRVPELRKYAPEEVPEELLEAFTAKRPLVSEADAGDGTREAAAAAAAPVEAAGGSEDEAAAEAGAEAEAEDFQEPDPDGAAPAGPPDAAEQAPAVPSTRLEAAAPVGAASSSSSAGRAAAGGGGAAAEGAAAREPARPQARVDAEEPWGQRRAAAGGRPGQGRAADRWGADSEASGDEGEAERRRREEEDQLADPVRAQELRLQGNEHFKAGRLHDAREAYSEALHLTPSADKKDKAILYANRAACLQKLGRWEDVVTDCKAAIDLDPEYVKAYSRRSAAYEEMGRWHDASEDLKKAMELDPALRSKEYKRQAVLQQRAQQQFEKDKDEMLSKLKDLGNTVLGKFGMSVDNFKLEQDPNTGGYSIKYQS